MIEAGKLPAMDIGAKQAYILILHSDIVHDIVLRISSIKYYVFKVPLGYLANKRQEFEPQNPFLMISCF